MTQAGVSLKNMYDVPHKINIDYTRNYPLSLKVVTNIGDYRQVWVCRYRLNSVWTTIVLIRGNISKDQQPSIKTKCYEMGSGAATLQ